MGAKRQLFKVNGGKRYQLQTQRPLKFGGHSPRLRCATRGIVCGRSSWSQRLRSGTRMELELPRCCVCVEARRRGCQTSTGSGARPHRHLRPISLAPWPQSLASNSLLRREGAGAKHTDGEGADAARLFKEDGQGNLPDEDASEWSRRCRLATSQPTPGARAPRAKKAGSLTMCPEMQQG